MKLIKKMKKGFTLVELVVVIAIIAILAGVSVGVYVGITSSAKKAADSEIITQLNTKLRADSILEGRNNTAMDAFKDAKEIGFDLSLMKPQYGDHYVWDEENDLFAVKKGDEVVFEDATTKLTSVKWKQWIFTSTPKQNEEISQFYTGTAALTSPFEINAGFDAGLGSVEQLSYVNSEIKDVVIRTTGGNLVVDAPEDIVKHYGFAELLDVKAVDFETSYHEYGSITLARVVKGHFVVENDASVNILYAIGTKAGETAVKVDKAENGVIGKAYATDDTCANTEDDNVTPKQDGNVVLVKDESVTSDVITAVSTENFVESATTNTTLKKIIANNAFRGEGTTANPYLISSENELEKLRQLVEDGNEYTGKTFLLTKDLDMSSFEWKGIGTGCGNNQYCFEGIFDGGNKTIANLHANNSQEGFGLFSYVRNATIKNFTISNAHFVSGKKIGLAIGRSFGSVDFENITVDENSSISSSGSVIGGVVGCIALSKSGDDYKKADATQFVVKNLTNKATVTCAATNQTNTQRVGGVIAEIQCIDKSPAELLDLTLYKLTNEGTVSCDYSSGILGAVQSDMGITRTNAADDFTWRTIKFEECNNMASGVKGEIVGWLDGAPKYFEFNKCKISSNQQNCVSEWNSSLVYCRSNNTQYTVNMFDVSNGTSKTRYLIAMNAGSGIAKYENITEEVTSMPKRFPLLRIALNFTRRA